MQRCFRRNLRNIYFLKEPDEIRILKDDYQAKVNTETACL